MVPILGNSTLSVLLMECGLFSSLMPTAAFQWNKGRCKSWTLDSGLDHGLDYGLNSNNYGTGQDLD